MSEATPHGTEEDISHMERCLALAGRGEFRARPNPLVGSRVVRDGRVVGEGAHERFGEAHAEVNALRDAGEAARGATLYVTLEPCSHWGKTGPCCERIIEAGVARVVYGMRDPNPQVAGRGLARLRQAGVAVSGPLLEAEAAALNPGFIKRMTTGLPWVRCKMGMSLDGRTAMASGESQWITGEVARHDVQQWRARSGAIVTGVETVLADDPGMNVRLSEADIEQPLRVIVDSSLRTPPRARILRPPGRVVIATALDQAALAARQDEFDSGEVRLLSLPGAAGRVDLGALGRYLAQEADCNEVLLETGAILAGAMLRAGLVDEMLTYIAPVLLGSDARPLFDLPGLSRMADRLHLEIAEVAMLGKDCRMRSRVVNQ